MSLSAPRATCAIYALTLLPEGQKFLDELFEIMATVEAEVLAQLSPDERPIFDAALDRMYDVFHP